MLAGELYDPSDPDLAEERRRARELLARYNAAPELSVLRELLGRTADDAVLEPPFYCDYGTNISIGRRFYANTGCVFLDCARIEIGDHVFLGPNVQLYAVTHPLEAELRRQGLERGLPITIGDDAWLGGGVIVCPGVEIGEGAVVGAGSVVVRDIPAHVVAAGNPCRPIRSLDAVS